MYIALQVQTGKENEAVDIIKRRVMGTVFEKTLILYNLTKKTIRNGKKISEALLPGYIIAEIKESLRVEIYHFLKSIKLIINILEGLISKEEFESLKKKSCKEHIEVTESQYNEVEEVIKTSEIEEAILEDKAQKARYDRPKHKRKIFISLQLVKKKLRLFEFVRENIYRIEKFAFVKGRRKVYSFPKEMFKNIKPYKPLELLYTAICQIVSNGGGFYKKMS